MIATPRKAAEHAATPLDIPYTGAVRASRVGPENLRSAAGKLAPD